MYLRILVNLQLENMPEEQMLTSLAGPGGPVGERNNNQMGQVFAGTLLESFSFLSSGLCRHNLETSWCCLHTSKQQTCQAQLLNPVGFPEQYHVSRGRGQPHARAERLMQGWVADGNSPSFTCLRISQLMGEGLPVVGAQNLFRSLSCN